MTWTPAAPVFSTWAKDTTTPSTWGTDAPLFAAWDVESMTGTQRITQDGRLRITETGNDIRIIERFATSWSLDPPSSVNLWTKE